MLHKHFSKAFAGVSRQFAGQVIDRHDHNRGRMKHIDLLVG